MASRKYVGVVAGGYEEEVNTDEFKVVVTSNAELRHNRDLARWSLVNVDTQVWDNERKGTKFEMQTLGIVEDVSVVPAHTYEDSREMAHSDYYANPEFQKTFSSTAEDALALKVRSIGHLTQDRRDLYGPVRPPERESLVYIAEPDQVRIALLKPMNLQAGSFTLGGYATLDGLYTPFTKLELPSHQAFLHGAFFAASGWGKTMAIKHFIREFHNLNPSPAIVIFNIKGSEFYRLGEPLPDSEIQKIGDRSPEATRLWEFLNLQPQGFDSQRISYYPMSVDVRGTGQIYSFSFGEIEPNEEGASFLRFIMQPFNLYEASMNYLTEYMFFCKRHATNRASREVGHNVASLNLLDRSGQRSRSENYRDTLSDFVGRFREAQRVGGGLIQITCSQCNELIRIPEAVSDAISRAISELQRLNIFDVGAPVDISRLMTSGHLSVIDVAGLQSGLAQQIFIQHLLHQIYYQANRIFLEGREEKPTIIFLDEAWRFFRSPRVLDELEIISRMGRSLRMGLWLADQNIPTGEREWNVLNNIRTRVLGSITADRNVLQKVMPLEETMLSVLSNLRRGMAICFNQEFSRIPTPTIIPPCTCYHEGD